MPVAATTLRALVDASLDAGRTYEWALFDGGNRLIRAGRDRPAAWPAADRREAVIAATHGRLTTVTVPPLPPARAGAAVRFAVEEQLADAPEESHVAFAPQAADGSVRTAIVADDSMRAFLASSERCGIRWDRALLESDLAPPAPGSWRWCAGSVTNAGFVRTDRGATIAVGSAHGDMPPGELMLALSSAGEKAPRSVRVDADGASAALLANAKQETRVEFLAGKAWRWSEATPAAFASAIDLLTGSYDAAAPRGQRTYFAKLLRPALWIAALAIGIQIVAGVGEWLWLRWQTSAVDRDLASIARAAVPEYAAGTDPELTPIAALMRRERDLKHRAGLAARDDFVPLLARAAPALGQLPPGAVRGLAYADGHVTLELQKLDPEQTSRVQRELQQAGLVSIAAPTASGARLRIGLN
jgi:general secretion pathway protein L